MLKNSTLSRLQFLTYLKFGFVIFKDFLIEPLPSKKCFLQRFYAQMSHSATSKAKSTYMYMHTEKIIIIVYVLVVCVSMCHASENRR